jgi:hypothetical protein
MCTTGRASAPDTWESATLILSIELQVTFCDLSREQQGAAFPNRAPRGGDALGRHLARAICCRPGFEFRQGLKASVETGLVLEQRNKLSVNLVTTLPEEGMPTVDYRVYLRDDVIESNVCSKRFDVN